MDIKFRTVFGQLGWEFDVQAANWGRIGATGVGLILSGNRWLSHHEDDTYWTCADINSEQTIFANQISARTALQSSMDRNSDIDCEIDTVEAEMIPGIVVITVGLR